MIPFDGIINWVKRHECNIITNGNNGLLKREKFINNMNQKLYNNKIMMKPNVTLTHLSSRRNTNIVTFYFKEIILNLVSNKSMFHPINLLLDQDESNALKLLMATLFPWISMMDDSTSH